MFAKLLDVLETCSESNAKRGEQREDKERRAPDAACSLAKLLVFAALY